MASAGLYASLHLAPDRQPHPHPTVFYRPDALPAAQPTASKHWRQKIKGSNNTNNKLSWNGLPQHREYKTALVTSYRSVRLRKYTNILRHKTGVYCNATTQLDFQRQTNSSKTLKIAGSHEQLAETIRYLNIVSTWSKVTRQTTQRASLLQIGRQSERFLSRVFVVLVFSLCASRSCIRQQLNLSISVTHTPQKVHLLKVRLLSS